MDKKHAQEILTALANWYKESDSGPFAGSLLFADGATLKEHITAALGGVSLERLAESTENRFDNIPATKSK